MHSKWFVSVVNGGIDASAGNNSGNGEDERGT